MIVSEEDRKRTEEPGFSGYFRNKHRNTPGLANLPTDGVGARKFAQTGLKATPIPNDYYLQLK